MWFSRRSRGSLLPTRASDISTGRRGKKWQRGGTFDLGVGVCALLALFILTINVAPDLFHTANDIETLRTRALLSSNQTSNHALSDAGQGAEEALAGEQMDVPMPPPSEEIQKQILLQQQQHHQQQQQEQIEQLLLQQRKQQQEPQEQQEQQNQGSLRQQRQVHGQPRDLEESPPEIELPSAVVSAGGGAKRAGENEQVWRQRSESVKSAFLHAWNGYSQFAFGHDEIRPTTNQTNDSWGGFGATLVDGLDTMMIMGLDGAVRSAREHVSQINFDKDYDASFFETTIRYLGGLLSAYELSNHDAIYLQKAKELGDRLIKAFDVTGLPLSVINLKTGKSKNHAWNGGNSILSEVGSAQVEFAALSYYTNETSYAVKSRQVFDLLNSMETPHKGLYPVYINGRSKTFTNGRISFGSLADSFYEYELKLYHLTAKKDRKSLAMYLDSMDGLAKELVRVKYFQGRSYTFLGELFGDDLQPTQEHLSCFVPGLLALGASLINPKASNAELSPEELRLQQLAPFHLQLAEQLVETCVLSYFASSTGLGAEAIEFNNVNLTAPTLNPSPLPPLPQEASELIPGLFTISQTKYMLRPETIESLFVLYRVTGKVQYREWGWKIFQAIEHWCRTPSAFSGVIDVNVDIHKAGSKESNWDNSQQSFFFAETLKYLYLLFSPNDLIPLDRYVFNTEAHPIKIFGLK